MDESTEKVLHKTTNWCFSYNLLTSNRKLKVIEHDYGWELLEEDNGSPIPKGMQSNSWLTNLKGAEVAELFNRTQRSFQNRQ